MKASRLAVRAFARWVDDPTECPFAFDLILDPETLRICGQWAVFGATDVDRPAARGFVLEAGGALRFGGDDRNWRTDLRERPIAVGERFSVWWTPKDRAVYEIVKVATLGSKKA